MIVSGHRVTQLPGNAANGYNSIFAVRRMFASCEFGRSYKTIIYGGQLKDPKGKLSIPQTAPRCAVKDASHLPTGQEQHESILMALPRFSP